LNEPVISGNPTEIFELIVSQAVPLYLYTFRPVEKIDPVDGDVGKLAIHIVLTHN
jgi:hypothetical protein